MEQQSTDWFKARIGVLTGTTFRAAMSKGEARKTLIMQKVAESLTQEWQEVSAKSLDWGNEHEDLARSLYEFETGKDVEQVGLIFHEDTALVAISPDGIVDDGGIEIKCPSTSKEHIRHMLEGLPAIYKPQVQGSMWVTNRKWWDFISYDPRMPDGMQLHKERIFRDEAYIETLSAAVLSAAEEIQQKLAILKQEQAA